MKLLDRIWRSLKLTPVAAPAVAEFEDKRIEAETELEKQREGTSREKRHRRVLQAELDRMILAATREVLRKGKDK